jgi:renal tumor antigen
MIKPQNCFLIIILCSFLF